MKLIAWALVVVTTVSGCVSQETQAQRQLAHSLEQNEKCRQMGAATHQEFMQCRMSLYNQEVAQQNAQSEAYGRQMQAVGAQLLAPRPVQQTNRPVRCTSYSDGYQVHTNCM